MEKEIETVEEKFELTVESKLENLQKISEFIDKTMRHYNIVNLKDIHAVKLSVDEACTNIIEHAYLNKEGTIIIRCMLSNEGKFVVNILDWGEPFDPTATVDPNTEIGLNDRKEGGLGIFFMKKFMDEIKYVRSDNMNLLTVAKHIKNENKEQTAWK
jgi:serine/threonine-protein kinase RsbW